MQYALPIRTGKIPSADTYDHLTQAVLAGLRMIRGALLDDRVYDQAFDLPIAELIDNETIQTYRRRLINLTVKQRFQREQISEFRARDIQTEAALVTSLHPAGAVRMLCALGILDIFAPRMGTLFGNVPYDYHANETAIQLIKTMGPRSHLMMQLQRLSEGKYVHLGVYNFFDALQRLGHETNVENALRLFDIRRYWN